MITMKELQEKSDTELGTFIREKREVFRSNRFSVTGSNMRNTHTLRAVRKEIARALTERSRRIRERSANQSK